MVTVKLSEEDLVFTIFVTESETIPIVYADFSSISSNNRIDGECEESVIGPTETIWECTLTVTGLTSFAANPAITFFAEDGAGNTGSKNFNVQIYEVVDADATINFVAASILQTVPRKIDRRVASQTALPLFIPVQLFPAAGVITDTLASKNIIILDKSVRCKDAKGLTNLGSIIEGTNFLSGDPYLFNKDSDVPYIVTAVSGSAEDLLAAANISINCTLSLEIQAVINQNKLVFSQPEKENILVNVSLFDAPGGTVDSALQGQIDGLQEHIKSRGDEIEAYEEWNDILRVFCFIAMTIGQIDSVLQSVLLLVAASACGLVTTTGIAVLEAPFKWTCYVANPFHTFAKFFWNPGLSFSNAAGSTFWWACSIHSCKLADPSFYRDLALSAIAGLADREFGKESEANDALEAAEDADAVAAETDAVALEPRAAAAEAISTEAVEALAEATDAAVGLRQEATHADAIADTAEEEIATGEYTGELEEAQRLRAEATRLAAEAAQAQAALEEFDTTAVTELEEAAKAARARADAALKADIKAVEFRKIADNKAAGEIKVRALQQDIAGIEQGGVTDDEQQDYQTKKEELNKARAKLGVGYDLNWREEAEITGTPAMPPEQFGINPYKSIHFAAATLCLPGMIYNLKKEQQLSCLQLKCLQDSAEGGFSTVVCNDAYKERRCLYYDSAQWRDNPDVYGQLFNGIWEGWWNDKAAQYRSLLAGISTACDILDYEAASFCPLQSCLYLGTLGPVCGTTAVARSLESITAILDTGDFFDVDALEADLEGTDYCRDIDLGDGG